MATRKPTRQRKVQRKTGRLSNSTEIRATDQNVSDVPSAELLNRLMLAYASATNADRQFVDWRDGLKPVGRRILYVMSKLTSKVKAQAVVGNTMSGYHPHGDSAIYGALVTLVNSPTAPVVGTGNWGKPTDGPAAPRYVECVLSEYGRSFFVPAFVNDTVTPFGDNYDNARKEPLVLPSLLPNVFFNGTAASIGVGISSVIPSFTPTSVLSIMLSILDGEKPDVKRWVRELQFFEPWGGHMIRTKENFQAFAEFLRSPIGKGSIMFSMDHVVDDARRVVTLKGFMPSRDTEKLIERIRELEIVRSVSMEGKGDTVVRFVAGINADQFQKAVAAVKRLLTIRRTFSITVLDRSPIDVNNPQEVKNKMIADEDYTVNFHTVGIPKLMGMWLKWRIDLERRSLEWRIDQLDAKIAMLLLLITAADNKPIVMKALDSNDPAGYLSKAFKWTRDQADMLLAKRIRQLSKADAGKFREQLAATKRTKADLQRRLKNPRKEVRDFLAAAKDAFVMERAPMGANVWRMKRKVAGMISGTIASTDVDDDSDSTAAAETV